MKTPTIAQQDPAKTFPWSTVLLFLAVGGEAPLALGTSVGDRGSLQHRSIISTACVKPAS